jgi:hypothetical protein
VVVRPNKPFAEERKKHAPEMDGVVPMTRKEKPVSKMSDRNLEIQKEANSYGYNIKLLYFWTLSSPRYLNHIGFDFCGGMILEIVEKIGYSIVYLPSG